MVFRFFRRQDKTASALAKTRRGWGGSFLSLFSRGALADAAVWEQVEEALISADVGVDTSLKLVSTVRERARKQGAKTAADVVAMFKQEAGALLRSPTRATPRDGAPEELRVTPPGPYVVLVVGVNGVGKTTSIAKLASHEAKAGKRVLIGAGDTFRAAAVEQLRVWGDRLGVDVISHQQGADPGAVAFDAFQAAAARGADVLIFDTAGRLHTKAPLMEELRKVHRVFARLASGAPHEVLLVIDATTGHNGLEQARVFKEAVRVDGVLLAKLDGTAKGGIAVAIAQELGLPVRYIGTGEGLDDLAPFDVDDFVDALFGEPATAA